MQLARIASILVPVLVAGCASTPAKLQGDFVDVDAWHAANANWLGAEVRWGGVVVGSRATDAGQCLEIAQYPLDRFTLRPYQNFPGGPNAMLAWSANASYPKAHARFLACDADSAPALRGTGAVVTMTGQVHRAQVFQVSDKQCERRLTHNESSLPDYSSTAHASADGLCVIALPTLALTSTKVWDDTLWKPTNLSPH